MKHKRSKIVFIGAVDLGKVPTNGESVKNQILLKELSQIGTITIIDTAGWKRNILTWIKLFWYILPFHINTKYILSASNYSCYRLIRIFHMMHMKRQLIYWVIGGSIADWMQLGKVEKKYYRSVQTFVVEGNKMKNTLRKCGFENVIVVPNCKPISYIPPKRTVANNKIKFIFLSRITPTKGCNDIFDSVIALNKAGLKDEFIVDFYGSVDKIYSDEFEEKLKNTPNIQYKGFLDLRIFSNYDILSEYDIMLFPTFWEGEGFPGIVIDAYLAGLPIIASDWNLNTEIIQDGSTGIIIPPRDVNALSKTMKNIILKNIDIEPMKYNCQQLAQLYNSSKVINNDLFERLGLI